MNRAPTEWVGSEWNREYRKGVLAELGDGIWTVGTASENVVALELIRHGMRPPIVRQQLPVGKYRLDFAWPTLQVGLEVDGWRHGSADQALRDAERDRRLRDQGWLIFRVDDQQGPDSLRGQVERVIHVVRRLTLDLNRDARKAAPGGDPGAAFSVR